MKTAFSTAGYPHWDVRTVIEKAATFGFNGVELRSLHEQLHLPLAHELNERTEAIVETARDKGVEIVCLATNAEFSDRDGRLLEANRTHAVEQIDLAARIGCPCVRVRAGRLADLPIRFLGKERKDATTVRIARTLREVGSHAADAGVTVIVENSGDYCESAELWQVVEAVQLPSVQCAWDPVAARRAYEHATTAIPRLAARLKLVRITDARFDEQNCVVERTLLGGGELEVYRTFQLLRGIGYRSTIVFDHPAVWAADSTADEYLKAASEKLTELLKEEPVPLTAYKGDKFPPRQGYDLSNVG